MGRSTCLNNHTTSFDDHSIQYIHTWLLALGLYIEIGTYYVNASYTIFNIHIVIRSTFVNYNLMWYTLILVSYSNFHLMIHHHHTIHFGEWGLEPLLECLLLCLLIQLMLFELSLLCSLIKINYIKVCMFGVLMAITIHHVHKGIVTNYMVTKFIST